MNKPATETLSVVVERELPFPPEKLWRALTQPHLIAEWLIGPERALASVSKDEGLRQGLTHWA